MMDVSIMGLSSENVIVRDVNRKRIRLVADQEIRDELAVSSLPIKKRIIVKGNKLVAFKE